MDNTWQKHKKYVTWLVLGCFVFFLFLSTFPGTLRAQDRYRSNKAANMIEKEIPKNKTKHKRSIWPFIVGGAAIAAVVIFLLVKKSGNDENTGPITVTQWGKRGSGPGEFLYISDICIDKDGYVYISDPMNNRIQIFNQDGKFKKQLNISVGGLIIYNKKLYTTGNAQGFDGLISVYDLGGRLERSWIVPDSDKADNQICSLGGIAVAENGNVYVTESAYNRVFKYTPNGVLLQTWTHGPDGLEDYLNGPSGLIIKKNEVFVVDSRNYRILVFDLEGKHLRSWAFHETSTVPRKLAILGDSYLYIASLGATEVGRMVFGHLSKYDLYGTFLGANLQAGLSPLALAVNSKKQKIYVANYYNFISVLDAF